jgi:hypothetical protein
MCDLDNNLPPDDIDREIADLFIERLRAAPEPVRMELARQLLPDMKSYAQFKAEARAASIDTEENELSNIRTLIERLLCWPLMSSRQRQLSDNAICKDIETAAAALERMTRENEELRVENAKAFARQIAAEDEIARLQKERDAIRAKTIEDVESAIRACPCLDEDGHVLATSNVLEAIRALNQPPEAEGTE